MAVELTKHVSIFELADAAKYGDIDLNEKRRFDPRKIGC